jgi:hypothetical protein
MGAILDQVRKLRAELYPKLKGTTLQWQTVDLGFNATVEVCVPASVTVEYADVTKYNLLFTAKSGTSPPLFLPVTKKETWEMAQYFKAFPLTSKVMDSTYSDKSVTTVAFHGGKFTAGAETDNFVNYSDYLASKGADAKKLFSGAVKLWILSNVQPGRTPSCPGSADPKEDPSVNYGMYNPTPQSPVHPIQGAAACHDQNHHDYSQILQLMKNFKLYGHDFDIGTALLTAHPGIWREGAPYAPTSSDKKYLPFPPPLGTNPKSTADSLAGKWTVNYTGYDEDTYVFKGNKVSWSDKSGGSGDGFWIEKNGEVTISWRKTGSIEVWPTGDPQPLDVTLNYIVKGKATKTS